MNDGSTCVCPLLSSHFCADAVRAYASAYCPRLSDSVYLSLVRGAKSRVTRGSGFFLGVGRFIQGEV